MEFSPFNIIVKLCIQGMSMEEKGKPEEACQLFMEAWKEATVDHEKFLAAYYVSKHQKNTSDRLQWLETSLEYALKINDDTVKSALPGVYQSIAECYEGLSNHNKAKENSEKALLIKNHPSDKGPFYHGTKADLKTGDFLNPGGDSNYQSDLKMNHIYFTALPNGAGLAAALARGNGQERVYIVETTGDFENDPNVTDKKFPGNPTRSYRSQFPLKIVGELTEWIKPNPDELRKFRERLNKKPGEIIN